MNTVHHDYGPAMARWECYQRGRAIGYRRGVRVALTRVLIAAVIVAFFAFYFSVGGAS